MNISYFHIIFWAVSQVQYPADLALEPPPRYVNNLVVDNQQRILLFAGKHSSNNGFDDLWAYQNNEWTLLNSDGPARWDHSYSFMESTDQLLIFGGRNFQYHGNKKVRSDLGDTWIYADDTWENLKVKGPDERSLHSMVYDKLNDRIILFGGRNDEEVFGDTWEFKHGQWKELMINSPGRRFSHSLSYDSNSGTVIMFGGRNEINLLGDTWVLSNNEWLQIHSTSPGPRFGHAMACDKKGRTIICGGWSDSSAALSDIWFFENNKWHNLGRNLDSPRFSHAISYDQMDSTFIVFGGAKDFNGNFINQTEKININ